jgi:DNA polymerase III delta prime subunit
MSEADAGAGGTGREIWIEKYRPETLEEIHGQDHIVERLQSYIEQEDLPHLLFSGPAGVGKTTAATAIARTVYGDDWRGNFLELNASDQRGIDVVRDRIKSFARSSFGGFEYRVVFLDEADSLCVPPGTEVITGYPSTPDVKPIEEVSADGEPIPSVDFETNEIQSDEGRLVDSGVADFFELELDDGRTMLASPTHPFFVLDEGERLVEKELRELSPGDEIADFRDEIGVSRCEMCGHWTAGRSCSVDCNNEGHSRETSVENTDYPVCDISGDNDPMRDPEVAQTVSDALQGHEPTGGTVGHSEELDHLVRSDWEYEVGKALQDAGLEYEYEPAFELSESVYHPGFLVGDTVIEVNGVAELWGQTEKVEEFLDTYGDEYAFIVVRDGGLPHRGREEFEPAVLPDGGRGTVETATVSRIEYSHRGKAYNISMEGTPNFMLANGVLTHNTDDAQSALRRTMEQFADNTRFILSCNYSSRIIDPIQSRCAVFRFRPLDGDAIATQVRAIAEEEGIELTDDGLDALVYAAGGDMRRAINSLQAAATTGEVVDEEAVFTITSTARPEDIREMVELAIDGEFLEARSRLETLLTETGMAGDDVVDQLHRSVWDFDVTDREAVTLMEQIGEADYRITAGASEQVQLEALLASLALETRED